MSAVHAVVKFPYITMLPRDVAITTWNFGAAEVDAEDIAAAWGAHLADFWNTPTAGGNAVAEYIGQAVSRAEGSIEWFEIPAVEGPLGEPFRTDVFAPIDPTFGSDIPLPLEVACVSSQVGQTGSPPVVERRRRGRQYIGPLSVEALQFSATELPRMNDLFVDTVADAAARLAGHNADDPTNGYWSVWSRVNWTLYPIERGWVNNEFDTQRRREVDPTSRQTWG